MVASYLPAKGGSLRNQKRSRCARIGRAGYAGVGIASFLALSLSAPGCHALGVSLGGVSASIGGTSSGGLGVSASIGSGVSASTSLSSSGISGGVSVGGSGGGSGSGSGTGGGSGSGGLGTGGGPGGGSGSDGNTPGTGGKGTGSLSGVRMPSEAAYLAARNRICSITGNSDAFNGRVLFGKNGAPIGVIHATWISRKLQPKRIAFVTLKGFASPEKCVTIAVKNVDIGANGLRLPVSFTNMRGILKAYDHHP